MIKRMISRSQSAHKLDLNTYTTSSDATDLYRKQIKESSERVKLFNDLETKN